MEISKSGARKLLAWGKAGIASFPSSRKFGFDVPIVDDGERARAIHVTMTDVEALELIQGWLRMANEERDRASFVGNKLKGLVLVEEGRVGDGR